MKRFLIALAVLAAASGTAVAADPYERSTYTPDTYQDVPVNRFRGFGIEAGVGYAMTAVDVDLEPLGTDAQFRGISADGITGVVGIDYLFAASKWRFGPYVEGGLADVTTEVSVGNTSVDLLKQDAFYGAGLSLGFVEGTSYFGVRVGYEWQDWVASNGTDSVDVDAQALLVGLVYSMALLDSVELKLTVDALNYHDISVDGVPNFPANDVFGDSLQGRAMARIVYRPQF